MAGEGDRGALLAVTILSPTPRLFPCLRQQPVRLGLGRGEDIVGSGLRRHHDPPYRCLVGLRAPRDAGLARLVLKGADSRHDLVEEVIDLIEVISPKRGVERLLLDVCCAKHQCLSGRAEE